MIRIVIADDHPILRYALRELLSFADDFDVIGDASDGIAALDRVRDLRPDILLLDIQMPNLDGLAVLRSLRNIKTCTKVILLTESEDNNDLLQAMKLGCLGILPKHTETKLINQCVRKVNGGDIWLDTRTTAAVMQPFRPRVGGGMGERKYGPAKLAPLTPREREIVQLVAQGFKNKEMSAKIFISEQTVKNHLRNIFNKLGVSGRLELALYAIHTGLYQIDRNPAGFFPLRTRSPPQSTLERITSPRCARRSSRETTLPSCGLQARMHELQSAVGNVWAFTPVVVSST